MKKLFFLLLLLTPYYIYSQKIIKKQIQWTQNTENQLINNKKIPIFKDIIFDTHGVPIFSESINLTEMGIADTLFDVSIENIKYQDLQNSYPFLNNFFQKQKNINFSYKFNIGRNKKYVEYSFYPFRYNGGVLQKIISFDLIFKRKKQKTSNKTISHKFASNSVLSSGKWVKIGIVDAGVYKITFQQLQELGFANPQNVRVFGNDAGMLPYYNNQYTPDDLVENYIYKGSDFIAFYAEAPSRWYYSESLQFFYRQKNVYTDTAYYFLSDKNTGFNNSIPSQAQATGSATATFDKYIYCDIYELDTINLLHSGRIWLGNSFMYEQSQDFNFQVPNIATGETGKIRPAIAVRSSLSASFTVSYAGQTSNIYFSPYNGAHYQQYVDYQTNNIFSFSQNSNNITVNLTFNKPTSSANAWLDYIMLNAKALLKYDNQQIIVRNYENIDTNNISEYKITNANSNVLVWDITNPRRPEKINATLSNSNLSFKVQADTLKTFVVFSLDDCLSPILSGNKIGTIANQNLHNVSSYTDMLIISPADFLSQAQQIADIHSQHDNLNVVVADVEKIYNEFSSGAKDVSAVRNYIRMVYEKTNKRLAFVYLLGDGTYDNRHATTTYNPNFLPTYQSYNSFNTDGNVSTVSDDYFGLLDENEGELTGNLDVAVGRFPAKTTDEADVAVSKLQSYYDPNNAGDWQNIVTFLADDKDKTGDSFTTDAENISNKLDTVQPCLNIKKIYLDAYQQQTSANGEEYPQAVIDINNRINNGTLIFNYLGHGSERALTSERVITIHDINSWNNAEKLALFITGTCEFSHFDNAETDADATSAGELVILNPDGGAIALLTTARVSFSGTNYIINDNFFKYLFNKENGKYLTIGQAFMNGKNLMTSYNKYFFVLLGDPAVRLNFATNNVVATKLNNTDITSFDDTIHALEHISIEGEIRDEENNKLTNFNGKVMMTFFDKKKSFQTLNNDNNGSFDYWNQYNILFKGSATVTNGDFAINFVIPKDIYYNFGASKFSFFAFDAQIQAKGCDRNIILGGIDENAPDDNQGPQIRLFMNDSNFVDGGITDKNPAIYALLFDENGINTSSASIGHDIAATLDNNPNSTYSLNEYYEADIDDFRHGTLNYGLYKLNEGEHNVKLKAWDTYNNPSEAEINFLVLESNELTISHLLNYPNPFTTHTSFYFEHNKPGIDLDILLQIFTVSGKVVKTIHTTMNTSGYRSDPIEWDGLDDYGKPIGRGAYIYSLKVRTPDGKIVQKFEKILILK